MPEPPVRPSSRDNYEERYHRGMTALFPPPGRWRQQHLVYGPISDAPSADKREIAQLIQRGRAVTDQRLAAQALAYARFRARVLRLTGLLYLVPAGIALAASVTSGSAGRGIAYAAGAVIFVASAVLWLWLANRCRRGAQATAEAATGQ